jgi:hypothetical protein
MAQQVPSIRIIVYAMSSSDVDFDARTETLPPVFTGRARPVLIAEDGTRMLPWIDTDVTPMALVARDGTVPLPQVGQKPGVAGEPERATLAQWVSEISVLLAVGICGALVVALAIAVATR